MGDSNCLRQASGAEPKRARHARQWLITGLSMDEEHPIKLGAPPRLHEAQSCNFSPGTRANSRGSFVTSTQASAGAWPAIIVSFPPINAPRSCKLRQTRAASSAAASLQAKTDKPPARRGTGPFDLIE
jgi:hypothetical protein